MPGNKSRFDPFENIQNLEQVAQGEIEAHVWRSRNHPGVLVCAEFVEIGEEPEITEPRESWDTYNPYYDGVMSTTEAKLRAKVLRNELQKQADEFRGEVHLRDKNNRLAKSGMLRLRTGPNLS